MLQQQTQSPGWRVLNRDVIKYIAMTAMLLNHIANIFLVPGTLWYEVLVDIGYFTAITMCYFLVEGFRYTHSRKQYALRLFGFGVVSQVPFSMAFAQNGILEFQDFNMMFTLFLCFCILLCIETIRNRFLRGVLIVLLIFGSLFCDWALLAPGVHPALPLVRPGPKTTAVQFCAFCRAVWLAELHQQRVALPHRTVFADGLRQHGRDRCIRVCDLVSVQWPAGGTGKEIFAVVFLSVLPGAFVGAGGNSGNGVMVRGRFLPLHVPRDDASIVPYK